LDYVWVLRSARLRDMSQDVAPQKLLNTIMAQIKIGSVPSPAPNLFLKVDYRFSLISTTLVSFTGAYSLTSGSPNSATIVSQITSANSTNTPEPGLPRALKYTRFKSWMLIRKP